MRACIDQEGCIACGLCVKICPEVFHQKKPREKAYVHQDPVPKEAEEGVLTARERCPVSVIHTN